MKLPYKIINSFSPFRCNNCYRLEILSIIGLDIPMPYAPFIFALFVIGIGHTVLLNGVKQFSNLNLAASIY
jgi:hypothetical protein